MPMKTMDSIRQNVESKYSPSNRLLWAFALIVCVTSPATVLGLGFRIPNLDAEATARGNAFTATADNPSAIYYNPAGISQLEGLNAQFGMHLISVNSTYQAPNGTEAKTRWEAQPVPQFYASYTPKQSAFSYGLGLYAPHGLGLQWHENNPFRTAALEGRLAVLAINPVVSWKALPNLSVAVGPSLQYSRAKLRQGIGSSPGDEFKFRGDGFDIGFTAGVLYKPCSTISLGAAYRSATTIDHEGSSVFRPYAPATDTTAEVEFPQIVTAGISYRPTPKWNVEFNVDWTDWDTLNTINFEGTAMGTVPFPLNWESSFLYEFGVTRYLDNGYYVAAGYFFSENSTPDEYFTPVVPDTDLHVASVGVGYKGEKWRWALSGQLITGAWREVNNSVYPNVNGRYQWFNQAINLSLGYRF
jgi:long-chain fatty acid transport protein